MAPISMSKDRPSPQESFTQMADKDLESIGRHCQFEYCNQLDFLPFRCESCRGTFCLDHRTETSHKCPKAERKPRHQSPYAETHDLQLGPMRTSRLQNPHQHDEGPGRRCPNCNRQYCLKHRLREEHDCAKITPLGGRPAAAGANANETLRSMFARVRTWGKEKSHAATQSLTPTPKPNSPAARAVQLNTLKKSAKGDANVPADKRLYLHVVGTSDTQRVDPPNGDFYFDSRWKVGRVLDDAARRLRVENVNNRADEKERLRIFHVESGEFLEFSDAIGAGKVQSGHTIVLMRGAGVMLGK
ncbi:AN1 zinc finger protein [Aspergillus arachidicola]|uniref:AN1 zinc finger protein n=1 Tax=Aspergillus arachidicola TaxID=656916 RepID=A0A2G7FGP6_9EURO|nr:AN1 zinc finger protein [Aspergillus arachidicola]